MNKFERLFHVVTRPLVVALCCVLILFSLLFIDQPVAEAIHAVQLKLPSTGLKLLSCFGTGSIYIILLAVIALSCRFVTHNRRLENRAWFLWLCVVVPYFICIVVKISLGRARPELWFLENLYGFYGPHKSSLYWSFPSGHTTTIMGLMFGFCALFPRYCLAFIVFGIMVAGSRILLTEHYVSDVLFAGYLALIEVGLLYYWSKSRSLLLV